MAKRSTALREVPGDEFEQQALAPAPPSFTAPDAVAADTIAAFADDPFFVTAALYECGVLDSLVDEVSTQRRRSRGDTRRRCRLRRRSR